MEISDPHLVDGTTRVNIHNGISIGSAAFAELTVMSNRQTERQDHAAMSVGMGRI